MIDITKPIHYHLFPYNLKNSKETIKTAVKKKEINILKREFNLTFIEDEVPNENTYIFYKETGERSGFFLKEMVESWLKHNWKIEQIENIYSINELFGMMNKKTNLSNNE